MSCLSDRPPCGPPLTKPEDFDVWDVAIGSFGELGTRDFDIIEDPKELEQMKATHSAGRKSGVLKNATTSLLKATGLLRKL